MRTDILKDQITNWLYEYLLNSNLDCFVVGVSGGIDSAVVSTLCVETKKKTILVSIPINQNSEQLNRANNHINWLVKNYNNAYSLVCDMTTVFSVFKDTYNMSIQRYSDNRFMESKELSFANSKSRLRMITLYQIAGDNNGLVVGTGNKVEDFGIGFFTKYGDGGVDLSPIADLTKTEVKELGKKLGINQEIIDAKPTDGLWEDDRTDEDQIGASYEDLEWAMSFDGNTDTLEENKKNIYLIYQTLHNKNKHKMIPIPVYKKE